MKMKQGIVLGAVLGLATAQLALAEPTALNLIKKGNDYVGVQSKDKVVQVFSDRSVASLDPNIWHIVYYDPSETFTKTVEVKFEAGEQTGVAHPVRPFQMPAKTNQVLDVSKITVDSDRAVQIASSQPLLKGLKLRYSKLTLQNGNSGPEWKIELWAAKVSDPTKDANVGTVRISAADGSVLQSALHPGNAGA